MMSNHHLRNKKLSLKAVGLMSKILSLPDEWDYSLKGLAKLNADGIDGVRSAVQELEDAGYIIRRLCGACAISGVPLSAQAICAAAQQ